MKSGMITTGTQQTDEERAAREAFLRERDGGRAC